MIVYVDIDDTICKTIGTDYESAIPIADAIVRINKMYEAGHTIVFWTARGTILKRPKIKTLTETQLKTWGVKYHELKFGKPAYDWFIDDKNINSLDWLDGKNDSLF